MAGTMQGTQKIERRIKKQKICVRNSQHQYINITDAQALSRFFSHFSFFSRFSALVLLSPLSLLFTLLHPVSSLSPLFISLCGHANVGVRRALSAHVQHQHRAVRTMGGRRVARVILDPRALVDALQHQRHALLVEWPNKRNG